MRAAAPHRLRRTIAATVTILALLVTAFATFAFRGQPQVHSVEEREPAELRAIAAAAASTWRRALWQNVGRREFREGHWRAAARALLAVPPLARGVIYDIEAAAPPDASGNEWVRVRGRNRQGDSFSLILKRTPSGWRSLDDPGR